MSVVTAKEGRSIPDPNAWQGVVATVVLAATVALLGCTAQRQQPRELTAREEEALADTIESQARDLLATWSQLEPEPYLRLYSDDLQFFFRQWSDRAQFEKLVRKLMATYEEYPTEVTDAKVEVLGRDAGVATLIYRAQPVDTAGQSRTAEAAFTLVYERLNGEWKVVHAHESVISQ